MPYDPDKLVILSLLFLKKPRILLHEKRMEKFDKRVVKCQAQQNT